MKRKTVDVLQMVKAGIDAWAKRELPRMDDKEAAGARTALAMIKDILEWEIQRTLEEQGGNR